MATTQDWIDEANTIRARILASDGHAGVATREQIEHLTGIQIFEAMLAGKLPFATIAKTLDYALIAASLGEVTFQGSPSAAFLNPMGTVHGGWYGTLLDSAMGCAVHTMMPAGRAFTTADYSVSMVRGLKVGGVYRTIGKVLHCGRQMATAEGRIVDADGKLYAHGTTTCLVFDLPSAPANEKGFHTLAMKERLTASDAWMAANPPVHTDLGKLAAKAGLVL
jgi:uncharacterized protein (TIGR00369 family)